MFHLVLTLLGCGPAEFEGEPGDVAIRAVPGWSNAVVSGLSTEIYTPSSPAPSDDGRGLLMVLHGCAQGNQPLKNRVDWENTAETYGMVIALPQVSAFGCYQYYGANHSRNSGDAKKILDLVDHALATAGLEVDPNQVYVAGLSAGGSMAMVMGCLAPDVFAGIGLAAAPTVGTGMFDIFSVNTTVSRASSVCTTLAGSQSRHFATQLASAVGGTSDVIVAQGYTPLNADVMAAIYATGAPPLTSAPLDVSRLPGYQPTGTGEVWSDDEGPRVSLIVAQGMGHAWPGGTGAGSEAQYVASQGVDYGRYLADFFTANNRRADIERPTDPTTTTTTTTGTATTTTGTTTGTECPPWIDQATDDISGHISRYDVYPRGYGVVDATYVQLLDAHGVSTPFTLFLAASGDWFLDPANLPAPPPGACE